MNGYEILQYLHGVDNFRGVLAAEEIIGFKKLEKGEYIICNTLTSREKFPGHWIVLSKGVFFDSLARRPENYSSNFKNYLLSMGGYAMSKKKIQHNNSTNCGFYCIYFILMRNQNKSFQQILDSFSDSNLLDNDRIVLQFINNVKKEKVSFPK